MLSFSAIKTEVIARLGNRTDIDARVERWINYGWFELLLNPRFSFFELDTEINPFVTTIAGIARYSLPTDLWIILDLRDVINSRKLRRFHYSQIDNQVPTTGQPVRYIRFGNQIQLDPIPDTALDIALRYRRRTSDIGEGTDLLIGTEWEETLVVMSTIKGFEALNQKDHAGAQRQILEQVMSTHVDVPALEDADSEPTLQPILRR